jgi:hypothetical protein
MEGGEDQPIRKEHGIEEKRLRGHPMAGEGFDRGSFCAGEGTPCGPPVRVSESLTNQRQRLLGNVEAMLLFDTLSMPAIEPLC